MAVIGVRVDFALDPRPWGERPATDRKRLEKSQLLDLSPAPTCQDVPSAEKTATFTSQFA